MRYSSQIQTVFKCLYFAIILFLLAGCRGDRVISYKPYVLSDVAAFYNLPRVPNQETLCGLPTGPDINPYLTVNYHPIGLPLIFSLSSDGSISVHYGYIFPTLLGEVEIEGGVSSTLLSPPPPECNEVRLIIKHIKNGALVTTIYDIKDSQDEVTVVLDGRTTVQVTNKQVFIDATEGNTKRIEVNGNFHRGKLFYTYKRHSDNVNTLAWSPDGKYIASGSGDETVQVWNSSDGKQVYTHPGPARAWWDWGKRAIQALAWSPDNQYIASAGTDGTVQVWKATDRKQIYLYKGHSSGERINALAWSPDGKRIASGSADDTVQVWDALDGKNVYTYHGHSEDINALAWSPDGKRIASGSADDTVQVWDAQTGSHEQTYTRHHDDVTSVKWSPNGEYIASGSKDGTVQVWDAATLKLTYSYEGHVSYQSIFGWQIKNASPVQAVAWSPDSKQIASASTDHTVQVWNALDGKNVYTYRGHSEDVNTVSWSPDGEYLASGSADDTVQVWAAQESDPSQQNQSANQNPSGSGSNKPQGSGSTQPIPTVTGIDLSVSPNSYDCSKKEMPFTFNGVIYLGSNPSGTNVTYVLARSDGATMSPVTVPVPAGQTSIPIKDTWTLYQGTQDGTYWERVDVSAPNNFSSKQANFTVDCVPR